MPSHTKHSLFASSTSAITQHFLQDLWDLETPICSLATTGECRYTLYHKLCSIEFLVHATFTCIESTFSYLHKKILSHACTTFNLCQPWTHMHISAVFHTHLTNAGTCYPNRLTCLVQESTNNFISNPVDISFGIKTATKESCFQIM